MPPISTVAYVITIIKEVSDKVLNSDQAKKNDDRPPNPLNKATISGIDVIFTRNANIEPIRPPNKTALKTKIGLIISTIVTKTATSIPEEETKFPLAAVSSLDSIFSP